MKQFTIFILLLALLESCSSKKNQESKVLLQLDSISANSYRKLFSGPFGDGSPSFNWSSIEVKMTDEEKRMQIKLFTPWILEENVDSAYLASVHITV